MKPKALLFDFYGTIVEEADNYIARVCKKISQHSKVKMLESEMWKYWHEVHVQMCNEAFNVAFHLQREILVITGKNEELVKEEHTKNIAQTIPNAKLELVLNTGHFCPMEDPKKVNRLISDFLL
jgi:pimeloyl-ACP methyl ester carboxylesterase